MLIEFRFGNFRSFKDTATLSMVAASKLHADPALDAGNVVKVRKGLDVLRVAAIYGANASGKSNIINALQEFITLVEASANVGFETSVMNFIFESECFTTPISFEALFAEAEKLYRYGFEIKPIVTEVHILKEWLYQEEDVKETLLFERKEDTVRYGNRFREGLALLNKGVIRRKNALFLSLANQIGEEVCGKIVQFFTKKCVAEGWLDMEKGQKMTEAFLEKKEYTSEINALLQKSDTGIEGIKFRHEAIEKTRQILSETGNTFTSHNTKRHTEESLQIYNNLTRLLSTHVIFNDGKPVGKVDIPFLVMESHGTQKLFAFAGICFDVLKHGKVLVMDEMEANFHPLITQSIVNLFQSPETNPKNAQLIFVTHDTNLLDSKRFRRDQIWFVEKDRYGASHLYSLAEFKGVRKDDDFEKNYIEGRYGAIPYLGDFAALFRRDEIESPEMTENTSSETADAGT
jgi:uncharacterized protein